MNSCRGSQGRAPSLHFANLSCLCSAVSAARRACSLHHCSLSYLAMVLVLFWKYSEYLSMFTTTTLNRGLLNNGIIKVSRSARVLDHMHAVRMQCVYACNGYIIYQKNSTVQLTSVGLAHTRPNYHQVNRIAYL